MSTGGREGAGPELPDTLLMEADQCIAVSSILGPKPSSPALGSSSIGSYAVEFPRKRKISDSDSQTTDGIDVNDLQGREAHSQTEKRRRDKMNILIEELSAMIPQCGPFPRKLDKLTVLRKAVLHLKSLKDTSSPFIEERYKPSFLPHDELRDLILRAADGFLFVVGCDRGNLLFVSDSVSKTLKYTQADLIGHSLFDYLHPKDVAKVKEQLSSSDMTPHEKLIEAKNHRMYCTIHCTGYLRSWLPSEVGMTEDCDTKEESTNFSCLVAIGRLHPYITPQSSAQIKVKPAEFVTRYAMDGKFVYVDQRATAILGYLPQELLGTSCYEYFHQDDHSHLTDQHKTVLQSKAKVLTNAYKFKTKHGSFITLKSQWFSFINPWTKELEYIVSINTVVSGHCSSVETASLPGRSHSSEDPCCFINVPGMSTGIVLGAGSIGTQIANEILTSQRLHSSANLTPSEILRKSPAALNFLSREVQTKMVGLSPSEIDEFEVSPDNEGFTAFLIPDHLLGDGSHLDFAIEETSSVGELLSLFEADDDLCGTGGMNDVPWTF
ncbi:basic helix-loop-helix ARNT-like protein 2 isoform X2 [Ascaphus truei]|uniref:basic helix-loop-helix ARNT-like protein 2 isoform X2 n=1 Tax=Ascaphus truei TaxID=8439 RepID=UPI003F596BA4